MSYVDPASLHAIEDDRRAGMTGIACTGLIAATTSFLFVSYGLHAIIRYNRRTQQERTATSIKEAEQNRRSLFFRSEYGILLLNLIFSDFCVGMSFALNFRWIVLDGWPIISSKTCTTQAALIQFGDLSSAFGSLLLALHLFSILVFNWKPQRWLVLSCLSLSWFLSIILTIAGPVFLQTSLEDPFYAFAGAWCWISAGSSSIVSGVSSSSGYSDSSNAASGFEADRLWMHYLWVFFVAVLSSFLYLAITVKLAREPKRATWASQPLDRIPDDPTSAPRNRKIHHVARFMLLFPVMYLVTILPLAIFRVASLNGHHLPLNLELIAGGLFSSAGTFNVVIYSVTRRLFFFSAASPFQSTTRDQDQGQVDEKRRPSLFSLLSKRESHATATGQPVPVSPRKPIGSPASSIFRLETSPKLTESQDIEKQAGTVDEIFLT